MRETVASQVPLVASSFDHQHVRELEEMGRVLDAHPEFAEWVYEDVTRGVANPRTGRRGLSGEQVLRMLIVKQMTGSNCDQLSFHLGDGASYRAFCRLGICPNGPLPRRWRGTSSASVQRTRRSGVSKRVGSFRLRASPTRSSTNRALRRSRGTAFAS